MSELTVEPPVWLTQTKLIPPRLREDYLPRPRLLALLAQVIPAHSLTLISAPAGYGKTTLLAGLPSTCPALPLAWLALGEEDNDFSHFCFGIIAALLRLAPALGSYYVYCDSGCTQASNWYETRITLAAQYDYEVIKYPSLTFTGDGRPRLLAYLIPLSGGDGIYYFACDVACGDGDHWQRVGLYQRGSGTSASWDLDLDSANRPRFAFYQGEGSSSGEKLHYAWCNDNCLNAAAWDNVEVGLGLKNGENPDLEIDQQGRPGVAYIMQGGGGTGYAWCTGNCESQQPQWQHKVLDTATSLEADYPVALPVTCDVGMWDSIAPVLAFNPAGQPRMAHDAAYDGRCWIDDDPSDNKPPQFIPWQIRHSVRVVFFSQP